MLKYNTRTMIYIDVSSYLSRLSKEEMVENILEKITPNVRWTDNTLCIETLEDEKKKIELLVSDVEHSLNIKFISKGK